MYKLKVEKMHCKSCFLNIEDALHEIDESAAASADFEQRILTVETSAPLDKVVKAVEEAGYPAQKLSL